MGLTTLNVVILISYVGAMIGVGVWFARRQRSGDDYFLGGRNLPWLAVGMSMYASVTSAMTFMGLPGLAYRENISLLVVGVLSPLVAPILIVVFYPVYRSLGLTTSYQFIEHRFGVFASRAAAVLFMLARTGWLGTVIYAPSLALHVVAGLPIWVAILLIGTLATLYCMLGGMSAVVWTDVPQFIIMIGGAVWVATLLVQNVEGGVAGILHTAHVQERLGLFDWSFRPLEMTAAAVALSYFFYLMYDYGVDQVSVQRLMSVRSARGVAKAIGFNAMTDLVIISLLLFIGTGLFVYYQAHPGLLPEEIAGDRVLPYFILHQLPNGVSGLLLAALFAAAMSSVDSGLNSLTAVALRDVVRVPSVREGSHAVGLARATTIGLGIFVILLSIFIHFWIKGIVETFLTFVGLFSAPILGLFLLGMFTRRVKTQAWLIGAGLAIGTVLTVKAQGLLHQIYYFPLSLAITVTVSLAVCRLPTLQRRHWKRAVGFYHERFGINAEEVKILGLILGLCVLGLIVWILRSMGVWSWPG
ncbi:MAG TPA: sodium/solute symporter [Kiritimatiellia bacterium]|nr:sodium/solute symporter [Kiritimatiellia bacterium]